MTTADYSALQEKYENRLVKADTYFQRSTGMLPHQTLLKLGDYNLNGTPAVIGMKAIQLLFVLSTQEVGFFSRFMKGLHLLTLVFQKTPGKDPIRIPLRGVMEKLEPILGRESLALLGFQVRTPPGDFIEVMGNYLAVLDFKNESWERNKSLKIVLTQTSAAAVGYNNFAELLGCEQPVRVRIREFSSDKAILGKLPDVDAGKCRQLKWYFRSGPIIADGKLEIEDPEQPVFRMDFHPAIVDVMEDYQFKIKLAQRNQTR